ncbi:hypothetical protein [Synoicihabitans lomoniglobus]|uniref:Uncharacterized protein n=1 Tax=Synoicihabitans lomoniglobus TaxID=2909285 RepID=A0AAE9ZZ55_9BACT|nr:hypothetical protein [Opitutaceae bacterium LMO-M01]WED63988.1 hypothetical protein PXH66_16745 [Opitutaceae bacterium LMO-M01]
MSWITENFQIIFVVGSMIAWWLKQRADEKEEPPEYGDRPGREPIDNQQSDAARQVRERMRKLREQRSEQQSRPATTERPARAERPAPSTADIPPVLRELMGIPDPEPEPEPAPPPPPLPVQPAVNPQDRMAAQLEELEAQRKKAEATARQARSRITRSQVRKSPRRHAVGEMSELEFLEVLRDPTSARRAIVLREVLDKPVALR